jgi:mRNA-degrading endonuclease toxin of MazEF toxin-antitoxin module
MSVRRGDVVMVDWLYSDRTGSKVRPAVVGQEDVLNNRLEDTVLVLVSRTQRAVGATEVEIDPTVEPACGLRHRSVASCKSLVTIDQGLILRTLGHLSGTTMGRIDGCLKMVLALP